MLLTMPMAFIGPDGGGGTKKSANNFWTLREDAELCRVVGPTRWELIALKLGGRSAEQCWTRWHDHLDPNLKKKSGRRRRM